MCCISEKGWDVSRHPTHQIKQTIYEKKIILTLLLFIVGPEVTPAATALITEDFGTLALLDANVRYAACQQL